MALGTTMTIPAFSRDPLMQALHRAGRPWPARDRPRTALERMEVRPVSNMPDRSATGSVPSPVKTRAEYMRGYMKAVKQRQRTRLMDMLGGKCPMRDD